MISVAIIGSREYGKRERCTVLGKLIFISFLSDLVSSYDETELIIPQKRLALSSTIKIAAVSQFIVHEVLSPAITGVTPQQITHRLLLIDLLKAIDPLYLI